MYRSAILKVCLCVLCLISYKITYAQTITVKSIALQPSDMTAIEQPCFDINGDTCALLKIKTDNLEGMEFPNSNQYIKKEYSAGIYYIYVPVISKKLDLLHKDYMPVQIDMSAYGYKKLRNGKTYLIVLDAPKKIDLKSSVIIKVEPKQAQVRFGGQVYEANQTGTFEFPVLTGNHAYEVFAPNYHSQKGSISIGKSEAKTISVRLQPITHEVLISSNVAKARVFVDNMDYGEVGKLSIPQGEHTIRVQADRYVDTQKTVMINAMTDSLSFVLEKNKRTTHIHPTPVTIYSNSARIYKNNKEIKGWTSGAQIKLMPNEEYMLSDADGKEMTISVGSEPLIVYLDSKKCIPANQNTNKSTPQNNSNILGATSLGQSVAATPTRNATAITQRNNRGGTSVTTGATSRWHFEPLKEEHNVVNSSNSNRNGEDKVFDVVEQMPSFPGGDASLANYLAKNLKYPVTAKENGIQGRVVVAFVVNRDGSITDVKVTKSVDPSLDKEAVRLIKSMPNWIPGKSNGSPVRVKYTLPVTFRCQ